MSTPATVTPVTVAIPQQAPGAVQNKAAQIAAYSQGLDSGPSLTLTASSLNNIQQQIYQLHGYIKQLANALNTNAGITPTIPTIPAAVTIQEATASGAAIPATYPPVVNTFLLVVVTQSSGGGSQITWNAVFMNAPVNISPLASTINTFLFVGRADPITSTVKWFLIAATFGGIQ